MRVLVILPFALIGAVLGQRVTKASISDQFSKISAGMSTFSSALANAHEMIAVNSAIAASNQVLATIKSATSAVAGLSGELSLQDAADLVVPSQTLAQAAVKLMKDLRARSGHINTVGLNDEVLSQLKIQLAATQGFIDIIKTKVPASLTAAADEAAKTALDAIKGEIDFFSKMKEASDAAAAGLD